MKLFDLSALIIFGLGGLYMLTRNRKTVVVDGVVVDKSALSRGYRNNNPLNIRISSDNWAGSVPTSENTDGSFVQFTHVTMGFRAAIKLILNYDKLYGINTVEGIIKRWAPHNENDTTAYINFCTGAGADDLKWGTKITKSNVCKLVYRMMLFENHAPHPYSIHDVQLALPLV